jgi:glycosyltransferase involved in cell wall biosynthesis
MSTSTEPLKWICSQFGARENYAVPRALGQAGRLHRLYTDIWVPPANLAGVLNAKARSRFHNDLRQVNVKAFTARFLFAQAKAKFSGKYADIESDFDKLVATSISHLEVESNTTFFSYSYSCRHSIKTSKAKGLTTFLGQINPGPAEADIVRAEFAKHFGSKYPPTIPDDKYWENWQEEVAAADLLIVNSDWSRDLLVHSGVDVNKIHIIPLAYESMEATGRRVFNLNFNRSSPLRLLYLGGIGIRKGFHILVDAMRGISHLPVVLDVVGGLKGPKELLENLPSNIVVHGHVHRSNVSRFFDEAHAMVFPTLSDGFGLTQLEAQARKLPVIVSTNCAKVITHMYNGIVLSSVTKEFITDAISQLLTRPELVASFSENSVSMEMYSIAMLRERLTKLASR